jgi:hypothetical protein
VNYIITSYADRQTIKDGQEDLLDFVFERDIDKDSIKEDGNIVFEKEITKNIEIDIIQELIDKETFKEAVSDFLVRFMDKDSDDHKQLIVPNNEAVTGKYMMKNIIINDDLKAVYKSIKTAFFDAMDKGSSKERKDFFQESFETLLEKIMIGYIEKSVLLSKDMDEISIIKYTLAAYKAKVINLQDERQLKLWSRFWFLYGENQADKKILPYYDYPYEDEPIIFEGFNDLMPDNWNVVYPYEFWRKIDVHPVQEGKDLALLEIPLAVNIMVEIINILIMMWGKFYPAFWGWTGTQAVLGLTSEVFEWLTLETSRLAQDEKNSRKHYDRCYRWLRWEAEKMALLARNDMELRGNYYVGLLIEELIAYMLDHHFDVMPIFIDVNKMDEWRRLFDKDLQTDITWVLDKVKGIRHKLIEGKERKNNG